MKKIRIHSKNNTQLPLDDIKLEGKDNEIVEIVIEIETYDEGRPDTPDIWGLHLHENHDRKDSSWHSNHAFDF